MWRHLVGPPRPGQPAVLRYTGLLIVLGIVSTVAVAAIGIFGAVHWEVHVGTGPNRLTNSQLLTAQNNIRDTWLKASAGVAASFAALVAWGRLELSKGERDQAARQEQLALRQEQQSLRQYSTDLFRQGGRAARPR